MEITPNRIEISHQERLQTMPEKYLPEQNSASGLPNCTFPNVYHECIQPLVEMVRDELPVRKIFFHVSVYIMVFITHLCNEGFMHWSPILISLSEQMWTDFSC